MREESALEKYEIRPCTMEHLERYAEIYAKAFSGEPWFDPWKAEDAAVHLMEILEMRRAYGLECLVDGKVAGLILGSSMLFHYGRSFEINDMAVDPAYQRQGIARKLLERLLADLKEQGMADVNLITAREGVLPEFYEKFGFRRAEEVTLMGRKV